MKQIQLDEILLINKKKTYCKCVYNSKICLKSTNCVCLQISFTYLLYTRKCIQVKNRKKKMLKMNESKLKAICVVHIIVKKN